jgi:hypothetical protein
MVPCCMNSTISPPFLSQKTVAISFLAGIQRLFKLLWLALTARRFHKHNWNPGFITCYSYNVTEINHCLYDIAVEKSKPKPFSAFYVHLWAFSEPFLHKTLA